MENLTKIMVAIVACLVLVTATVVVDRARDHRAAKDAARLAALYEGFEVGSSGTEHAAPVKRQRGALLVTAASGAARLTSVSVSAAAPEITAAFFDSVFPTPQAGG